MLDSGEAGRVAGKWLVHFRTLLQRLVASNAGYSRANKLLTDGWWVNRLNGCAVDVQLRVTSRVVVIRGRNIGDDIEVV
jgi:uncharacterized membrane protein